MLVNTRGLICASESYAGGRLPTYVKALVSRTPVSALRRKSAADDLEAASEGWVLNRGSDPQEFVARALHETYSDGACSSIEFDECDTVAEHGESQVRLSER